MKIYTHNVLVTLFTDKQANGGENSTPPKCQK